LFEPRAATPFDLLNVKLTRWAAFQALADVLP
jgi:hypothetical protein